MIGQFTTNPVAPHGPAGKAATRPSSANGDGLILYWHGALPASVLNDVEASYPEVLFEIRPTKYLPGDLRDAAHRLVQTEADAGVGAAVPNTDGTGILALVHEDKVREDLAKLAARLSSETGFPVTVETGAPVPA